MKLTDLVKPDYILPQVKATTKRALLSELSAFAALKTGVDQPFLFETLLEREQLGTTGIGGGVALPHGRLPKLDKIYGFLAKLNTPIAFESVDKQPVDLIFLLLSPEKAGADHLKALALMARFLKNPDAVQRIRGAETAEGIFAVLEECRDSE